MSRWCWLALAAALLALAPPARAQLGYRARYARIEEPKAFRFQFNGFDAGLYSTYSMTESVGRNAGQSSTSSQFFIAPLLGLGMQGSVYHPNLFRFQAAAEGGYGWEQQTSEFAGRRDHTESWEIRGNYNGTAQLLTGKPLTGSISSSYGRSYREYDFFTRATVESLTYGSRWSYTNPWLHVITTYAHSDEDVSDVAVPFRSEQDLVSLDLRNDRARGSTAFNYTYNQYSRPGGNDTRDHSATLSDAETFGAEEAINVSGSLGASRRELSGTPEDQLTATLNAAVEHDERWTSDYGLTYDRFLSEGYTSDSYNAHAGVQHRLYDSLFSSLSADASHSEASGSGNSGYSRQYSLGLAEGYSKRLGAEHRLRLDASVFVRHIEQESTGIAINELHTFPIPPALEAFFLNLLNVIDTTLVVSDPVTAVVYVRNIDYEVFTVGTRTEIRRLIGGAIPQGATVRTDYRAQPTPEDSYQSHTEAAGVRFDLWKNLLGLYARISHTGDNAPPTLRTAEFVTYTAGTDLSWQWLRAGLEYQRHNGTESDYWSVRAFQTGSFRLDAFSSLSVGFSEAYLRYLDSDRQEQQFRFTTTYQRSLARGLRGNVMGGVSLRRGETVDQTVAVFRPELNYSYGRTTVQLAYNFEYNLYLDNEERQRHEMTLRVRREF